MDDSGGNDALMAQGELGERGVSRRSVGAALVGTAAGVVGGAVIGRPAAASPGSLAAAGESQQAERLAAQNKAATAAPAATITSGQIAPAVVTLADRSTISVNAALGNDFRVILNGHRTISNPVGGVDGQRITFMITQGNGGSFKVIWDTDYKFGGAGVPRLTKTAGSTDIIGFIYNRALGSWLAVGAALGF